MARYDDINTPLVAVIGFISAIVVFAIIVGVQALYFGYERSVIEQQETRSPSVGAANLIAEQETRLQRQGWINREEGRIAISIDRAMQVVVDDLRQEQKGKEAAGDT